MNEMQKRQAEIAQENILQIQDALKRRGVMVGVKGQPKIRYFTVCVKGEELTQRLKRFLREELERLKEEAEKL